VLNFPTSGAGTLYPPGIFHNDVTNRELFEKLSPKADDVWLYYMVKMNGGRFKVCRSEHKLMEWKQGINDTLWKANIIEGENDRQIEKVAGYYGLKLSDQSDGADCTAPDTFEIFAGKKKYKMVLPNWREDHIQRIIACNRMPYELEMLSDMQDRISANELYIDIGANIGNHTLFMASVSGCEVMAFEPNKKLVSALNESISINGLEDKVRVFAKGVGKKQGFASFEKELKCNIGAQKLQCSDEHSEIEIIALDSFLPLENLKMIKIDVEGMEMDVLNGAMRVIREYKPLLYMEANTEREFLEIYNVLKSSRYRYVKSFNATPTHLFIHDK
jgi:protein O-GlcNAc transferase